MEGEQLEEGDEEMSIELVRRCEGRRDSRGRRNWSGIDVQKEREGQEIERCVVREVVLIE